LRIPPRAFGDETAPDLVQTGTTRRISILGCRLPARSGQKWPSRLAAKAYGGGLISHAQLMGRASAAHQQYYRLITPRRDARR
jgi:hypothetical protein